MSTKPHKTRRKSKARRAKKPVESLPKWWAQMEAAVAAMQVAMEAVVERERLAAADASDISSDTTLLSAADADAVETNQDVAALAESAQAVSQQGVNRLAAEKDTIRTAAPEFEESKDTLARTSMIERRRASWDVLEVLHDDVHRLFRLGDVTGALISLERMVLLADRDARIDGFLTRNEERLLSLYERVFDGFDQVVETGDAGDTMGPDLRNLPKIASLVDRISDHACITDIMEQASTPKVEVAAILHHLLRTRRLRFAQADGTEMVPKSAS